MHVFTSQAHNALRTPPLPYVGDGLAAGELGLGVARHQPVELLDKDLEDLAVFVERLVQASAAKRHLGHVIDAVLEEAVHRHCSGAKEEPPHDQ